MAKPWEKYQATSQTVKPWEKYQTPQVAQPPVEEPKSFIQEYITEPLGMAVEPLATLATGAIAEPIAGIAGLAKTITSGPEAGAETIRQAREGLTYQPKTETGKESLQTIGEVARPVGEAFQAVEQSLGDTTYNLTGSPALSALATTVPTAITEVLGLASAKGAIKAPTRIKEALKERSIRKAIVDAAPDIEQIKDASRAVYREIDESGVALVPNATSKLINDVNQELSKAKYKPKFAGREVNNAIEGLRDEAGQALSLGDVDSLRQSMQGVLSGAASPNDKRIISTIVDTIDEFLDEAGPVKFTKGTIKPSEIMPKYKVARELWGRARRSELITDAFERASTAKSGLENGLRDSFNRILRNKKQRRFFKPEEIQAMKDVVQGSSPANISKLIGRFGFSEGLATNILGGTAGFYLGGPLLTGLGQLSRKLSQKITMRGANFADAIVRAGDDAKKITTIYMSKVPKAQRSAEELSELFLRQNVGLDDLLASQSKVVKEAAEIGKGRKIIENIAQASPVAVPGAIESTMENK